MKKLLFCLIIFGITFLFTSLETKAQSDFPDSLVFQGSQFDVGSTFRTATATSFGHYTINAYFKEANGTEHLAYVDNYNLYYFRSTDNGNGWSKEQITTGHEGDIWNCALTVDTAGKVFIGITVHDLYNYANPSGITSGGQYFLFDAYCVNNITGSWVTEQIYIHPGNYGPQIMGLFVDTSNNVHFIANRYGWYSYGGIAWEWVRNSSTNTWGSIQTIVEFNDAGIDRLIYNTYTIVPDQNGNVTIVMCRYYPTNLTRLFYVRYNGSTWSVPVNITDTLAVAWNRFDAVVDPAGHTYIAYMQNNTQGIPILKVMKDFQPAQTASINLSADDTLYYFRLHCSSGGLFTMLMTIKNQTAHTTFSRDAINWSDPVTAPDILKNYMGGLMVRTDARNGYFTDYCKQINVIAGNRSALPYGPDTLLYGSIRILDVPSSPNLISPSEDEIVDTSSVVFSWTKSYPEITNYWLEIDTNLSFTTPFIDSTLIDTIYNYTQLVSNKTYYWRLKARNQRCWGEYSGVNRFNAIFVSVDEGKRSPTEYKLAQNFPNPFNPTTKIQFDLPKSSFVSLIVYDMLGQEITTLVSEFKMVGTYEVQFNASKLSSGVYFYRLSAGECISTKKLLLIR